MRSILITIMAILLVIGLAHAQRENIVLSKQNYELGEPIVIRADTQIVDGFSIVFEETKYRFMGEPEHSTMFTPQEPGDYSIEAQIGNTIEVYNFSVLESTQGPRKKLGNGIKWLLEGEEVLPEPGKRYVAEMAIDNNPVKQIRFEDLNPEKQDIRIAANVKKDRLEGRVVLQSYAIDPSSMDFTRATVYAEARGTILWKCKEWEYDSQTCMGEWKLLKRIYPGQTYEFTLTPDDPGFAETGVATINSEKPIYRPGEIATLHMVVLDKQGFLANADVNLTVTDPAGTTTLLTTQSGIQRMNVGIYKAEYPVANEGPHSLIVEARAPNVNSNLSNSFLASDFFEFDIIRETPLTIDPWLGPFTSSIRVVSNNYTGAFSLTEKLPSNFTIHDSGGAHLIENSSGNYLVWRLLNNGSEITYSTNSPLASPDLYEMGPSVVSWENQHFEEARPWYLAIDPTAIYNPSTNQQQGWNDGTGTGYSEIDEGTTPVTGDYIRSTANDGGVSEFGFSSVTQTGISSISLYIYRSTGSNAEFSAFLQQGGTTVCTISVATAQGSDWQSCTWNNPAGDLSDLSVEFGAVNKNGGGSPKVATVYSAHLQVAFDNPPSVTLSAPSEGTALQAATVDFNFTPTDDVDPVLSSCSLWTNTTGTWQLNTTINNVANGTKASITPSAINDGRYMWNVECVDSGGQSSFAISNRSLTINANPPSIQNPQLNESAINQSQPVRFNASIADSFGIDSALIELQFPNGTRKNYTLVQNGDEWSYNIRETNQTGTYALTLIWANDTLGQIAENSSLQLSFTVESSPPSSFNLLAPANVTISNDLQPTLSWEATSDEHFHNYTILLDKQPDFSSPDFTYHNSLSISNTTRTVDFALDSNSIYYWRVIAYDDFSSSTNSSDDFIYVTDTQTPSIALNSPQNDMFVTSAPILFNATPAEANGISSCSLWTTISGSWQTDLANSSATSDQPVTFSRAASQEGTYLWNVWCNDTATNSAYAVANYTIKVDLIGPNVSLLYPPSGSLEGSSNTIDFVANVSDGMASVENCSLYVNSVLEQTNSSVTEGANMTFTEFLSNGNYTWQVGCFDTNGHESFSAQWQVEINVMDTEAPLVTLNSPQDGSYIDSSTIEFNYTPEDATGTENCSIYLDGVLNQTDASVANQAPNIFTVVGIQDGSHNWSVTCFDNSTEFNQGWSSTYSPTVDTTTPSAFDRTFPENASIIKYNHTLLNWTASFDVNFANYTIYLDANENFSSPKYTYSTSSPISTGLNATILTDGIYYWKVVAYDLAGNSKENDNQIGQFQIHEGPPQWINWSKDPPDPIQYNATRQYNFSAEVEELSLSHTWIKHNFTGTFINESSTNKQSPDNHTHYINYLVSGLAVGSYEYQWFANDTENQVSNTTSFTHTVTRALTEVNLTLNGIDSDITVSENTNVNMTAKLENPDGAYVEIYLDGALIRSGPGPLSNVANFTNPGTYNVTAVYNETQNYSGSAETHFITVIDTTPPSITLESPQDNATIGSLEVTFTYIVDDFNPIENCSLYINGTLNKTNESPVERDTLESFTQTFTEGSYSWHVVCYDDQRNSQESETRSFVARDTDELVAITTTDKQEYETGDNVTITTRLEDDFQNPLSGDVTTDLILANTSAPWWNTDWKLRKPLYMNTTSQSNLTDSLTEINISGLQVQSCNEVRIVHQETSIEAVVPHSLYDGDDSTWCRVAFYANVTGNASNEKNYYAYYNNSAAPNPGYDLDTATEYTFFAESAAQDEGAVLGVTNIVGSNDATSATIDVSGGGAASEAAHGRDFVDSALGEEILSVNIRYRYSVTSMAGNWYLRYSVNDGGSYVTADTSTTTVAQATSAWFDISNSYAELNWSELNRTRLQGRVDKTSGGGQSTINLFWVEMNVTARDVPIISDVASGSVEEWVDRQAGSAGLNGEWTFAWPTAGQSLGSYSAVSEGLSGQFDNGTGSSQFQIVPDVTPPNVALVSPLDFEERGVGNVDFEYAPYDINLDNCTLYFTTQLGFQPNETSADPINNQTNAFNDIYFGIGVHEWNVLCYDTYGNSQLAPNNFTLNVSGPDLVVDNIWHNDSQLIEGEEVLLFANITNQGLSDTNRSFIVQFFNGDPDFGGTQINGNSTITELAVSQTETVGMSYILGAGLNQIWVEIDENNSIEESDESNNKRNENLTVSIYHVYYGNITSGILLDAENNKSFYRFGNVSDTQGHVFVVDSDSSFRFEDLSVLGRTESDNPTGNDFDDADTLLGTSAYNDSIKVFWGGGTNTPLHTTTIKLSTGNIPNVPYVNSTNTPSFITGILWDSNDDAGANDQYDQADAEDLVFVTRINQTMTGQYGTYDYEIKVPKFLKEYKGTDDTVTFYYEIQ